MKSKLDFMMTHWGLDGNPFPPSAIHQDGHPFNSKVFPEETEEVFSKIIAEGCYSNREYAMVWSKSPFNKDTGLSKTAMLHYAAVSVNADFNYTVLKDVGLSDQQAKKHRAIAAYATFDNNSTTGIYPVVFSAVEYLANPEYGIEGSSVLRALRQEIVAANDLEDDDALGIANVIQRTRRKIHRTGPPLRPELIEAFCSNDEDALPDVLSRVSPTMRVRAGLAYLDFAITVAAAAEVPHVFLLIDQLEDLATTPTVTKAKRVREVGRFRDIASETKPFIGRLHFVFTFHDRAAVALQEMWTMNRLPSYDPEDSAAENYIVVLRGLKKPEQVKILLSTYVDAGREGRKAGDVFHPSAYQAFLNAAMGRPGIVLCDAHNLCAKAAGEGVKLIDGAYVDRHLGRQTERPQRKRGRQVGGDDAHELSGLLS